MENLTTKRPAAEGTRRNFFVSAAKKLNEKRKKIITSVTTAVFMWMMTSMAAFAEGTGGSVSNEGDQAFFTLVAFFAKWIGRIGLLVAFIGGVMFGLAIKNDEADQKQRGVMTLAAGFIVFALTKSLKLFFPDANIPLF